MTAPQRLLCQRASDPFQQHAVKGGFDCCSQCSALVRVADTSRDAIKIYTQVEIWSLECCIDDPPPEGFKLEYTDAQLEEIARVTGQSPVALLEELKVLLPMLRKQKKHGPA